MHIIKYFIVFFTILTINFANENIEEKKFNKEEIVEFLWNIHKEYVLKPNTLKTLLEYNKIPPFNEYKNLVIEKLIKDIYIENNIKKYSDKELEVIYKVLNSKLINTFYTDNLKFINYTEKSKLIDYYTEAIETYLNKIQTNDLLKVEKEVYVNILSKEILNLAEIILKIKSREDIYPLEILAIFYPQSYCNKNRKNLLNVFVENPLKDSKLFFKTSHISINTDILTRCNEKNTALGINNQDNNYWETFLYTKYDNIFRKKENNYNAQSWLYLIKENDLLNNYNYNISDNIVINLSIKKMIYEKENNREECFFGISAMTNENKFKPILIDTYKKYSKSLNFSFPEEINDNTIKDLFINNGNFYFIKDDLNYQIFLKLFEVSCNLEN